MKLNNGIKYTEIEKLFNFKDTYIETTKNIKPSQPGGHV